MKIVMTRNCIAAGQARMINDVVETSDTEGRMLISIKRAKPVSAPVEVAALVGEQDPVGMPEPAKRGKQK